MEQLNTPKQDKERAEKLLAELPALLESLQPWNQQTLEKCEQILAGEEHYAYINDPALSDKRNELLFAVYELMAYCITRVAAAYNIDDMAPKILCSLDYGVPELSELAVRKFKEKLDCNLILDKTPPLCEGIVKKLLDELGRPATMCYTQVVDILARVLEPYLAESWLKSTLAGLLCKNDTTKTYVYDLAVLLAKRSSVTLSHVRSVLDHALANIGSGDRLMEAAVLTIIADLAEVDHCFEYLNNADILTRLSVLGTQLYHDLQTTPLVAILKFFGHVAAQNPNDVLTKHANMVELLFFVLHEAIEQRSQLLPPAMNALCSLASSQRGLMLLQCNHADNMRRTMQLYAANLHDFPTHIKLLLFETLAEMFTIRELLQPETITILAYWLHTLAQGHDLNFLMSYCTGPFSDLKLAALTFVKAVVSFRFGVQHFKRTCGFFENILNRQRTESDNLAIKHTKYDIIRELAASESFDEQTLIRLNKYLEEGPLFYTAEFSVALEEQ